MANTAIKFLAAFGTISALYTCGQVYSFLSPYFRPSKLHRYLHSKNGKNGAWALVTGASDGVGNGLAEELCERGFNVVVHGRNASKLENVKRNLENKYPGRQIRTIVADASVLGTEAISTVERIVQELDSLYITVLVNNVGAGMGDRQYSLFLDRSLEEVAQFMAVNEGFPTLLTRALLPRLIQRQPALVINVGSILGSLPCPYLEPYSGAKAHNLAFSRALGVEMEIENYDVEFLHVRVMSVATPSSREEISWLTVSPRTMAKGALDRVGCGSMTTDGCFRHALVAGLTEFLMPPRTAGKTFGETVKLKIVERPKA